MEFVPNCICTLEDLRKILPHELEDPSNNIVKYPNDFKHVKEMQDNEDSEQFLIALSCVCKISILTIIQKPVLEF